MKISLNELRKIVRQTIAEAQRPEMDYESIDSRYDYEIQQGLGSAEAGGYMDGLGYFDPQRNSFVAGKALRNDVDPALANVDLTDDSGYGRMGDRAAVGRGTAKTEHEHVIDVDVLYGIPGTIQSGRGRSRETFYLDKNDPALREISRFGSAGYADPKEVLRILIKYDLVPATATMNTVAAKMGRMEQSFAELVD